MNIKKFECLHSKRRKEKKRIARERDGTKDERKELQQTNTRTMNKLLKITKE